MDILAELVLQILFEAFFQGLLEGFFELALGRDRGGPPRRGGSGRAAFFGVFTALTSLALGAWRGVARAEEGAGFGLVVAVVVAVVCALIALRRRRAHVAEVGDPPTLASRVGAVVPTWISSSLTTSRLVWFAIANALFAAAYVGGLVLAPTSTTTIPR